MDYNKVYDMKLNKVYPLLFNKAIKKNRTLGEVLEVTTWLTGYSSDEITRMLDTEITYGDFFRNAPKLNPNRYLVTGKICGVKIEDIKEDLMRNIRILDKLVDDLAKGKEISKILIK